jgi:hypothetical protein
MAASSDLQRRQAPSPVGGPSGVFGKDLPSGHWQPTAIHFLDGSIASVKLA